MQASPPRNWRRRHFTVFQMTSIHLQVRVSVAPSNSSASALARLHAEVSFQPGQWHTWLLPHELWLLGEAEGQHRTSRGEVWAQHLAEGLHLSAPAANKSIPEALRKALANGVLVDYEALDHTYVGVAVELEERDLNNQDFEELDYQGGIHELPGPGFFSALEEKYEELIEQRMSNTKIADMLGFGDEPSNKGGKTNMKFSKQRLSD